MKRTMMRGTEMSKNKKDKNSTYSKVLGKEGVIMGVRGDAVTKDFLISTLLGLTVVFAIRFISNVPVILGVTLAIFVFYYMYSGRKSKLKELGNGTLSYYTEAWDKQVVKVKHYHREGIKRELFSFGVVNLILIESLGVTIVLTTGTPYSLLVTLSGVGVYLVVINIVLGRYTNKVGKEVTLALVDHNEGIKIPLTEEEKQAIKTKLGVDDKLFEDTVNKEIPEPESVKEQEIEKPEKVETEPEEVLMYYTNGVLSTGDTLEEVDEEPTTTEDVSKPEPIEDAREAEETSEETLKDEDGVTIQEEDKLEESETVSEDGTEEGIPKDAENPPTQEVLVNENKVQPDEDILESIEVIADVKLTKKTNEIYEK